jgi:release factor glutamine methyltransferase
MNETELILCDVLNCNRSRLYLEGLGELPLSIEQQQRYAYILEERKKGIPLQYILARCEFFGLEFRIRTGVFIPRPETEILVEEAIEKTRDEGRGLPAGKAGTRDVKILDIGTGSGNIAISLAKNISNAKITAADISPQAITLARENAKMHEVDGNIEFIQADIFSQTVNCKLLSVNYDLIISNPPYIRSADIQHLEPQVRYEPKVALDGGEDGLGFYRKIISLAGSLLKLDGVLLFEIGLNQAKDIAGISKYYSRFSIEKIVKDYSSIKRVMILKRDQMKPKVMEA